MADRLEAWGALRQATWLRGGPSRPPPGRSSESIRADSDINFAQMIIGEDQCANLISFVTLVPRAAPRAVRRAPGRLEGRPSLSELTRISTLHR